MASAGGTTRKIVGTYTLHLSSEGRTNVTSNDTRYARFYVTPAITCDSDRYIEAKVLTVMLIHNFYNVKTAQTLALDYYDLSGVFPVLDGTISIAVPPGFYAVEDIINLCSEDATFASKFTLSLNQQQNRLEVHAIDPENVGVLLNKPLSTEQIEYMMGWSDLTGNETPEGTLVGPDQPDFYGVRHVFIRSGELGGSSRIPGWSTGGDNVLMRVPLNVNFGDIMYYEPLQAPVYKLSTSSITEVVIDFLDGNGEALDMSSANWSISVEVNIVEEVQQPNPVQIGEIMATRISDKLRRKRRRL